MLMNHEELKNQLHMEPYMMYVESYRKNFYPWSCK
jgi:hypothetical protein